MTAETAATAETAEIFRFALLAGPPGEGFRWSICRIEDLPYDLIRNGNSDQPHNPYLQIKYVPVGWFDAHRLYLGEPGEDSKIGDRFDLREPFDLPPSQLNSLNLHRKMTETEGENLRQLRIVAGNLVGITQGYDDIATHLRFFRNGSEAESGEDVSYWKEWWSIWHVFGQVKEGPKFQAKVNPGWFRDGPFAEALKRKPLGDLPQDWTASSNMGGYPFKSAW